MAEKTEYAVLKFMSKEHYCHIIHDSVQGHSIMDYVKEDIIFEKRKVFALAKSLARELEQFYMCEEEAYGSVNPYAVIIIEDDSVCLLDIWAEENKTLLEKMKKRKIRDLFVNPEYALSQRKRAEDDWYGFGKTVQFLMEKCCGKNVFTYREEKLLKKIYQKCEQKEKPDVSKWKSLQRWLEKLERPEKRKKSLLSWGIAVALGIALFGTGLASGYAITKELKNGEDDMKREVGEIEQAWKMENAKKDLEIGLGILHFMYDENYELGHFYLEEAAKEMELAQMYIDIFEYLEMGALDENEKEDLKEALEKNREEMETYKLTIYRVPVIKAYAMLEEEIAWQEIIELSEEMENRDEVRKYIALANEKLERYEEAIVEYEELKIIEIFDTELRWVYERLMELYYMVDLPEKVKENYEEAVSLMPKLAEDEAFLKLKETYGIVEPAAENEAVPAEGETGSSPQVTATEKSP